MTAAERCRGPDDFCSLWLRRWQRWDTSPEGPSETPWDLGFRGHHGKCSSGGPERPPCRPHARSVEINIRVGFGGWEAQDGHLVQRFLLSLAHQTVLCHLRHMSEWLSRTSFVPVCHVPAVLCGPYNKAQHVTECPGAGPSPEMKKGQNLQWAVHADLSPHPCCPGSESQLRLCKRSKRLKDRGATFP